MQLYASRIFDTASYFGGPASQAWGRSLTDEWNAKYPNHPVSYDTGGFLNNVLFKYPGWRAREGFGQPALGVVGLDACPPACAGTVSQGVPFDWPPGALNR